MAIQTVTGVLTGAGPLINLSTADDLVVTQNGAIASTAGEGVRGVGSGHDVTIFGTVFAANNAVWLGVSGSGSIEQTVYVAASGSVVGQYQGITLYGSNSRVTNNGEVYGKSYGIVASGAAATTTVIENFGKIQSAGIAIIQDGGSAQALRIVNHGTISGATKAFGHYDGQIGNTAETIVNLGLIEGTLDLAGGSDSYDGRGGTILGDILGGDGDDSFKPGAGEEVIDGGAGVDTIDFRSGGAVKVSLAGTFDSVGAFAANDVYAAIENIQGSRLGADLLVGSSAANRLKGWGGNDAISGGAGDDQLTGGDGIDRLTGGAGSDRFVFETLAQCGDAITDFTNAAGNNDSFRISAAGFGGGLVAGALAASQFRARADNLAQDADDRFIFRTTDKTLWFDANGSAAGGLTLVADLQSTATVTAADIILI